jgi:CRP-like cAMP-binding protein
MSFHTNASPVARRDGGATGVLDMVEAPRVGAATFGNRLLDALPTAERDLVAPRLHLGRLERGQTLMRSSGPSDAVYFPRSGAISTLCVAESGKTFETGLVGSDGFVGLRVVLGSSETPFLTRCTLAGQTWRLAASDVPRLLDECTSLRLLLLRFAHARLVEVSQLAACARAHPVPAQLARWILTASDRTESSFLRVTHELVSERIGTRRASVSLGLEALQRDHVLSTRSGKIRIENRAALERAACECYRIVRDEYRGVVHHA